MIDILSGLAGKSQRFEQIYNLLLKFKNNNVINYSEHKPADQGHSQQQRRFLDTQRSIASFRNKRDRFVHLPLH